MLSGVLPPPVAFVDPSSRGLFSLVIVEPLCRAWAVVSISNTAGTLTVDTEGSRLPDLEPPAYAGWRVP